MSEPKFKPGDKVDWCGMKGRVRSIGAGAGEKFPVKVDFDAGHWEYFTLDGRYYETQVPTLKLERPEVNSKGYDTSKFISLPSQKKGTIMMYPALYLPHVGPFTITSQVFSSEADAKEFCAPGFVRWLNEERFGVEVEIDEKT